MSSKCNQSLRKKYKITNWADYDRALRDRGDITVWISEEAIALWTPTRTGKRGGQAKYSALAIETAAKIRLLFTKRLRQTEGFLGSIMKLMELDLPIPDHTTISRRLKHLEVENEVNGQKGPINILIDSSGLKIYGEGEWNNVKNGVKQRRSWRKLHLIINDKGQIVARKLTKQSAGDSACINDLLNQIEAAIDTVIADGGYDGNPTYHKIEKHQLNKTPKIIIPPKKNSILRKKGHLQRNQHIQFIQNYGRAAWEIVNGYRRRLRVENTFYRYKTIIGRKLHSRDFRRQENEINIACNILNKLTALGMPVSIPA